MDKVWHLHSFYYTRRYSPPLTQPELGRLRDAVRAHQANPRQCGRYPRAVQPNTPVNRPHWRPPELASDARAEQPANPRPRRRGRPASAASSNALTLSSGSCSEDMTNLIEDSSRELDEDEVDNEEATLTVVTPVDAPVDGVLPPPPNESPECEAEAYVTNAFLYGPAFTMPPTLQRLEATLDGVDADKRAPPPGERTRGRAAIAQGHHGHELLAAHTAQQKRRRLDPAPFTAEVNTGHALDRHRTTAAANASNPLPQSSLPSFPTAIPPLPLTIAAAHPSTNAAASSASQHSQSSTTSGLWQPRTLLNSSMTTMSGASVRHT